MKAGKLQFGTNLTCESVRSGKAELVCIAADASEGTKKKIITCCTFYGVQYTSLAFDRLELGHSIGKKGAVSVVAVLDVNFVKVIKESFNQ